MTTSIRLNKEAAAALAKLRERPGGFNLNKAVRQMLIELAKEAK